MEKKETMTKEEIHGFGIQIVCEEMTKEGYELLGANPSIATTPQIVARKDGRLCFVVVRTDVYPNKGTLAGDRELFYNLEHAERNDALCYFASVGICNAAAADQGDERAMGLPVRDGGFYVDFDGLKVMTTIDRVSVAKGNGVDSNVALGNGEGEKGSILKRIGNAIRSR